MRRTNCVAFIERRICLPVAPCWGFPHCNRASFEQGMLGMHGNLGPNINTNKCDVLIAVGMRFDDRVTGKLSTYASQAKIIHFDIDPAEIDKNVRRM